MATWSWKRYPLCAAGAGPPFLGRSPFEVCWSLACIRSLRGGPWRVRAPSFPCVGHSCGIPDRFALAGIDYLVSFVLDAVLSNILAICCLTLVFILSTRAFSVAAIISLEIVHPRLYTANLSEASIVQGEGLTHTCWLVQRKHWLLNIFCSLPAIFKDGPWIMFAMISLLWLTDWLLLNAK